MISHGFEIEHSAESSPKYLPNFFRLFISNNAYLHVGVPDVYLFESLISSIPRTICNSIAQKFSVDGLVMRWSPADVQRCRRRIMRSCDRRFSRGSCNKHTLPNLLHPKQLLQLKHNGAYPRPIIY